MNPRSLNILASILRTCLSNLVEEEAIQEYLRSNPLFSYYAISPTMPTLEMSGFRLELRQEFLLRVHMFQAISTIASTTYSTAEDMATSLRNQGEEGLNIRDWYITAYRRLVFIAVKLFDNARELDNPDILASLDSLMSACTPATSSPTKPRGGANSMWTVLFSHELSGWSLENQNALLEGKYFKQRYDAVCAQMRKDRESFKGGKIR